MKSNMYEVSMEHEKEAKSYEKNKAYRMFKVEKAITNGPNKLHIYFLKEQVRQTCEK